MSFNKNLAKLRNNKGISEEDMAKIISCSLKEFKGLESGEREPKVQEIMEIAKCFAVSTDYLLGNEEVKKEKPKPFDPLSVLSGLALPGGFMLNSGDEREYDEEDEKLALELAEMASLIDTKRNIK